MKDDKIKSKLTDLVKMLSNMDALENNADIDDIIDTVKQFHKYPKVIQDLIDNSLIDYSDIKPVTSYVINTDDATAKYLLDGYSNPDNRNLDKRNLAKLKQSIIDNEFIETGENIKFSGKNSMIYDGHTRLTARSQIKDGSKTPFEFRFELEDNSLFLIDKGKIRKTSDTFHMMGVANEKIVTNVYNNIYNYKAHRTYGTNSNKNSDDSSISNTLAYEKLYERFPDVPNYVLKSRTDLASPSALSFVNWVLHKIDTEMADVFMNKLLSGTNLEEGNVILLLINKLRDWTKENNGRGSTIHSTRKFIAMIFKAWNIYRDDRVVANLRLAKEDYTTDCIMPR